MVPSAHPRRHFLPWDGPLLPQAAAWLAREWSGDGPLDLTRKLVIVPTRQSGRRLREMLAEYAAARGQAVFPPRVITPEMLLGPDPPADVASRLDSLLAWADLLQGLDLGEFREIFPIDPPARSFSWAFALARQLSGVRSSLAEGRLGFAEVVVGAGDFPEAARWRQLGELERRYTGVLAAHGLRDEQTVRMAAAENPPATGIDQVVLLAAPDPSPLALAALKSLACVVPVDVVVFAPREEAAGFDDWGRPVEASWAQRELVLPEFAQHVHLCADPTAQAERIAGLARAYAEPDGWLGVGVADPEVLPPLEGALAQAGVASFNPGGRSRRRDALYHLLAALAAFVREANYEAVESLARCPDLLAHLQRTGGPGFSSARFLAGLDELRARHLPADFAAACARAGNLRDFPELGPAFAALADLRAELVADDFAGGVAGALAKIFAARPFDPTRAEDDRLAESAADWTELLRACRAAAGRFPAITPADWWEIALRLFGETVHAGEKPAGALELQGWLELLWEDAPHVAVAGLNDGGVPEAVTDDPFLPGTLREKLGLPTNAARFARDAYLLQALAASRAGRGRIDLFFGKVSAVGDPLRPSRLLLRCADAALPERVAFLFRSPELAHAGLAWSRAWKLRPRREPAPARVAVTALRDYLHCPFRFYLRRVLGMEAVDPLKGELDSLDFGTLCHAALEAMGRDPAMREAVEADVLRDFLLAELERSVRIRYGEDLVVPLLIQTESARQRLAKAAVIQARERAAGWRIEDVEKKFALEAAGLVISGKIDRIERHELSGTMRVLDYKTSDQAAQPRDTHLRVRRAGDEPPVWAGYDGDGKPRVWTDLQLPLYRQALQVETGGPLPACGYFNLPKAVGETGLAMWDDAAPELQAAAWRCAEGVCEAIRTGVFWPPRELTGREAGLDPFASLFHQGAAESIAWEETR